MTNQDDAMFIITALHDGPDFAKMGASMISLVQLSEEFRLAREWSQALGCCDQLDHLVRNPDMQNISGIDTTYASGMARMSRGVLYLSQNSPGDAETCFTRGRHCFHYANTAYSEAVALLALALVHQAQRQWTRALGALQPSLTILDHLGHPLKERVLEMLRDVQHSLRTDLEQGMAETEPALLLGPSQPTSPSGTRAPVSVPLRPLGTPPLPARPRRSKDIPLVGRIAAGEAMPAEDGIEDYIAIDEEIADKVDFALKVKGYSMIKAAILEGDIVLMEQRGDPPPNGQIAAIIIPQVDNEATLKRFYRERDHIRLGPANDTYPLIIVKPDWVPEEEIRAHYNKIDPERPLRIYSGMRPQIAGWARGVIRDKIKITEEMKYQP